MKRTQIFIAMLVFVLLTGIVLANGVTTTIDRHVIAGGGGHAETGNYTLDATIGQPVVGVASAGNEELCAGFWCGTAVAYKIYLPLVMRNY